MDMKKQATGSVEEKTLEVIDRFAGIHGVTRSKVIGGFLDTMAPTIEAMLEVHSVIAQAKADMDAETKRRLTQIAEARFKKFEKQIGSFHEELMDVATAVTGAKR